MGRKLPHLRPRLIGIRVEMAVLAGQMQELHQNVRDEIQPGETEKSE